MILGGSERRTEYPGAITCMRIRRAQQDLAVGVTRRTVDNEHRLLSAIGRAQHLGDGTVVGARLERLVCDAAEDEGVSESFFTRRLLFVVLP